MDIPDRTMTGLAGLGVFAIGFAGANLLFRSAGNIGLAPPVLLSRSLLFASIFCVPLFLRGFQKDVLTSGYRDLALIVVLALTAAVIPFWLQLEGFARTTATKGGIILSLIPVLTVVFSRLLLKRKPAKTLIFRLGLMTAGGFLLSWEGSVTTVNPGDWLVFGAASCFAFSMIIAHDLLKRWTLGMVVQFRLIIGWILLMPVTRLISTPEQWAHPQLNLYAGITGALMILFVFGIYNGVQTLGPEYAALFDIIAAGLTVLGAYFLWGEWLTPIQWIGALLILFLSVQLLFSPPDPLPTD